MLERIRASHTSTTPQQRISLWRILIFGLLFCGLWLSAWGTLGAFPRPDGPRNSKPGAKFFVPPRAFNLLCWFGSFVPFLAVVGPSFIAYRHDVHAFSVLTDQYIPAMEETARHDLAIQIWLEMTLSAWWLAIALCILTGSFLILAMLYSTICTHVLLHLNKQIKVARQRCYNPTPTAPFEASPASFWARMAAQTEGHAIRPEITTPTDYTTSDHDGRIDGQAPRVLRIKNLTRLRSLHLTQFALVQSCVLSNATAGLWISLTLYGNTRTNTDGPIESVSRCHAPS